jgi:deazaflavin-dependent oxidoreductase (nitroreductase family)
MRVALLVLAIVAGAVLLLSRRILTEGWTLALTTTGRVSGQPRTATIWFVREGDVVYVQAGQDGRTDWYRNLLKTPDVTLAIGEERIAGRARPVEAPGEVERVHGLFMDKYWIARVLRAFGRTFGTGRVVAVEPAGGRAS